MIMQLKLEENSYLEFILIRMMIIALIAIVPLYSQESLNDSAEVNAAGNKNAADNTKVYISAEGNIQGIITNSSDETTTNTGAIGVFIVNKSESTQEIVNTLNSSSEFSAKITIASSADTIRNEFGGAMLNPGTGSQSAYIEWRGWKLKYRPWWDPRGWLNLHFYGVISSGTWAADNISKRVTTVAWGIHTFHDFINREIANNRIIVRLDAGIVSRGILGDISGTENEEFRKGVLGTDKRNFYGIEAGLTIQINSVKAFFNYLYLRPLETSDKVPGLTDGQVLAGFTIQANIMEALSSE
jgi:hypothetical protein